MDERIRIGISECLLGAKVRYDGGHKHDRYITGTLGRYFEFVPVCPEVGYGLGIPREALRLVGDPSSPRLVAGRSGTDHTEGMLRYARGVVKDLGKENLCGFIFKSDSPTSGMERVRVYTEKGMPAKKGVGVFARVFMEHFPLVPVEEEGRLHDPVLRDNFLERIFSLRRWRETREKPVSVGVLVDFHTRNKLLLMSHSPVHYRKMGPLVAGAKGRDLTEVYDSYEALMMEALALKATRKKHSDVLRHMMGYFKNLISADEKQELLETIDQYRNGHIPLIVPVTLFSHFVRKYSEPYLGLQSYLRPHPIELQLRNHV